MSECLATQSAHKDFAESLVWRDYTVVIQAWIEDIRDRLEVEKDKDDIHHYQGVVDACRRFLLMPESISAAFEMDVSRNGANNAG